MTPNCTHCGEPARLTDGTEVYPHRPDLSGLRFWLCDPCEARVGCHKAGAKTQHGASDGTLPLGTPANAELRRARMILHNDRLDPIWKGAAARKERYNLRRECYRLLSGRMGIPAEETHTALFTLEQCRDAWRALEGVTTENVRDLAAESGGKLERTFA